MRRVLMIVVGVAVLSLSVFAAHHTVADQVIAVTKAQWAAEMKRDVATAMKNVAEDCTLFNAAFPTRLDGRAMNMRWQEALAKDSGTLVMAEMANEKVQVYGDVAILSYNFIGATKDKDGKVEPALAKSTRVYVKQEGQWMLVHANFAPVGD